MFEALRTIVKSGRLLVGVIPLVTVCCGDGRVSTPTAPTSPTSPTAGAAMPATIRGSVQDPAGRSLVGARVEALDGPSAGTSATVGGSGYFDFTGTFTLTTRFRATYEDHESMIDTPHCSVPDCARGARPWMYFRLRPLAPPVDLTGDYTLALIAAEGCALPADARTRNYRVSFTPRFREGTADVLGFNIDFRTDAVLASTRRLTMGVAVDFVSIFIYRDDESEDPAIGEDLGLNRYVGFSGTSKATLNRASLSKIELPLDGSIEVVTTSRPLGNIFTWLPADIISRERCTSSSHRLVLSRM